MGVNINPGMNPEKINYLRPIPYIALPTVFGDALSYMECVGRLNAELNKCIDGINNVAQYIDGVIERTVENAKIPVYSEVKFNGALVPTPSDWELQDPEDIYKAINAGKMCILWSKCSFNIDGVPVESNKSTNFFILTEVYSAVVNNNTGSLIATFMNYNVIEGHGRLRYINVKIEYDGTNPVTSYTDSFAEIAFPTMTDIDDTKKLIKYSPMLYNGSARIPGSSANYVELTNNGTVFDVSDYFIDETLGFINAKEINNRVAIDIVNNYVGFIRFGGNNNPYVRIYGTSIRLSGDIYVRLTNNENAITNLQLMCNQAEQDIENLINRVEDVEGDIEAVSSAVLYTEQSLDANQKEVARVNIDAAPLDTPVFLASVGLMNEGGHPIFINPIDHDGVCDASFEDVTVVRNVGTPLRSDDAANKSYVDNAVATGSDNDVKYIAQTKSSSEKATARANIGAPASNNPEFSGSLSLNDSFELEVVLAAVGTKKVVVLGGDGGNKVVRNVENPVELNDAANKAYVDSVAGGNVVVGDGVVKTTEQSLTDTQKLIARTNINAASNTYAVQTLPQSFEEYGKSVARENIGAASDNNVVKFMTEQSLTDGQKIMARSNIGAASRINPVLDGYINLRNYNAEATVADFLVMNGPANSGEYVALRHDTVKGGLDIIVGGTGPEDYAPIQFAQGSDDNSGVTLAYLQNYVAPIMITINTSPGQQGWYATKNGVTYTLAQIIQNVANGARCIAQMRPSGDVLTVLQFSATHIVTEYYDANNDKHMLDLFSDGTYHDTTLT